MRVIAFVLTCFLCRSEGNKVEARSERRWYPSYDHGLSSSSAAKLRALTQFLLALERPAAAWQGASQVADTKTASARSVSSASSYSPVLLKKSRCAAPICSKSRRAWKEMGREKLAEVGDVFEGRISKLTFYGFVVDLDGTSKQNGLVHISALTNEWIPPEKAIEWMEEKVGTIGTKVTVKVKSTEYMGKKNRRSLELLDVADATTPALDQDSDYDGYENDMIDDAFDDEFSDEGDWEQDDIQWKQAETSNRLV
mmetsp:Transcript_53114/g.99563  ORF Transcript_53114/g.99563 Transcript_53114/m.99563 type:complete len:254 (-) Transcript_53114:39-800(-)